VLIVSTLLGLAGCNVAAKNAIVVAVLAAATFSLWTAVGDTIGVVRPHGEILVGLWHNVRLDLNCDGVPAERRCVDTYGLETAYALVVVHYVHLLIWLALALHLYRETYFIFGSFVIMSSVGAVELLLFSLHPHVASAGTGCLTIGCLLFQLLWLIINARTKERVRAVMHRDQEFYDKWYIDLCADERNQQALEELCRLVALIRDDMYAAPMERQTEIGDSHRCLSSIASRSPCPDQHKAKDTCIVVRPGSLYEGRIRQLMVAPAAITDMQAILQHQEMLFDNRCDFVVNVYTQQTARMKRPTGVFSTRSNWPGATSVLKVCTSMDSLFQHASCLRPILQKKIEQLVGSTPSACRIGGTMQTPLKEPVRAVEKGHRVYGDDCSLLLDVCRELLVFDEIEDLVGMLRRLHQDPEIVILRIKNRLDPAYKSSDSAGYRDVMLNVLIQNSESTKLNVSYHVAEIQLIPRAVFKRRGEDLCQGPSHTGNGDATGGPSDRCSGHVNYVLWRNLRGR